MRNSRFISILLVLAMLLMATACVAPVAPAAAPAADAAAAPAAEAGLKTYEDLVVGYAQLGAESEWRTANTNSVKAAAE